VDGRVRAAADQPERQRPRPQPPRLQPAAGWRRFKAGHVHGATDEFGYQAIEGPVSCPSLLATLLHQLGLDHTQLSYRHHGRDETLTDPPVTGARVVGELLPNPSPV
jgi:hypothetical protein